MASPPTSSGLRPRPAEHEPVPARRGLLSGRTHRGLVVATACLLAFGPAWRAWSQAPDLLENERAFAFAARALDAQTVEARFVVAPGYYLYRDKLHFSVGGAKKDPALPRGRMKHDEFFGESETYRDTIAVRLKLDRPTAERLPVTVAAESQGCADIGVCYPPQRQEVVVAMPRDGARPGTWVEAAPVKRKWFR